MFSACWKLVTWMMACGPGKLSHHSGARLFLRHTHLIAVSRIGNEGIHCHTKLVKIELAISPGESLKTRRKRVGEQRRTLCLHAQRAPSPSTQHPAYSTATRRNTYEESKAISTLLTWSLPSRLFWSAS